MFEPDTFRLNDHFAAALEVSDIVKYSRRSTHRSIDVWLNNMSERPRLIIETNDGGGLRFNLHNVKSQSKPWIQRKAYSAHQVIDQAGAGDWCSAGLIIKLLSNVNDVRWQEETVIQALDFGQALAAASIGFQGPRAYLESFSADMILEAANTTLLTGEVPDWISQVYQEQEWTDAHVRRNPSCTLCLRDLD